MYSLGPFRLTDLEPIKAVLEAKQVPYELVADEDMRDELMARHHEVATANPRGAAGQLNLAYIFFEIDPAHFARVQEELEKHGITAPSDGSFELGEADEE